MKTFCALAVCAMVVLSCSVNEQNLLDDERTVEEVSKSGVLSFASSSELNSVLEMLEASGTRDLRDIPLTRSISKSLDDSSFVSLRQSLIDSGLKEFTDDELRIIEAEGMTYEPEDTLILDPYFCAVLNDEREIIVGSSAYRYVDGGVIECDVIYAKDMDQMAQDVERIDLSSVKEGDSINMGKGKFTRIEYTNEFEINDDTTISSSDPSLGQKIQQPSKGDDVDNTPVIKPVGNTLVLDDGTVIKADKINTVKYLQDESEASNLQRFVSGMFGTNVVANNYYDSKHRMRLRMFSQDYIIRRSVGTVVRMQKKKFGIWWRIKADEFRYGWSAIECKYDYSKSPFQGALPSVTNGSTNKYPDFMVKKTPFNDKNIILFHIGLLDYDFTTGDLNKMFAAGMNFVKDKIQSFVSSDVPDEYKKARQGLFTVDKNDLTVYVTFPQDESVAYNKGREKIEWDFRWFSGYFVIGFGTNLVNSFNLSSLDIAPLNNVEITRGAVYSATKYNGEWRACVIKTVN